MKQHEDRKQRHQTSSIRIKISSTQGLEEIVYQLLRMSFLKQRAVDTSETLTITFIDKGKNSARGT